MWMKHQSQVRIAVLPLQAAPARKLPVNDERPRAITVLLPLTLFPLNPFSAFGFTEIIIRKRHVPTNERVGVQSDDLCHIDVAQAPKLDSHEPP